MDLTQIGAKEAVNRALDAVAQIDNLLYRRLVAGSAGQRRTLPFSKTVLFGRHLPFALSTYSRNFLFFIFDRIDGISCDFMGDCGRSWSNQPAEIVWQRITLSLLLILSKAPPAALVTTAKPTRDAKSV